MYKCIKKRVFKLIDPNTCRHHGVYHPKAFRYAIEMTKGASFPPVHAYRDKNGVYHIRNGAHRCVAAKLAGRKLLVRVSETEWRKDG